MGVVLHSIPFNRKLPANWVSQLLVAVRYSFVVSEGSIKTIKIKVRCWLQWAGKLKRLGKVYRRLPARSRLEPMDSLPRQGKSDFDLLGAKMR